MNEELNTKLVSVIIPVYNVESYIRQCLDSVCQQTYKNIEIIVVNDGSTDSSLDILKEYEEKDTRMVIIDQNNTGLSGARNTGLKVVKGEYVVFLDSDDWLELDCIEKAMEVSDNMDLVLWSYYRDYGNSSLETLLFEEKVQWDSSNISELYRRMVGLTKEELKQPQKIDSLITAWGKLYKRNVIENVEFTDTKIIGTEDALFNIGIMKNVKNAIYIPEILSHYRKDNMTSLTHSYKKKLVYQWIELYKCILTILKELDVDSTFYHALSNRICLGLIGLGMNLAEDSTMSFSEKKKELKKILNMKHYKKALKKIEIGYMPVKWKVFFLCARYRRINELCILLYIMNYLRGK